MRRLALALLLLLALPAQAQQWRNYKYLQVENLRLKGSPAFDVRAYGALCDGTTDDSTAINLALQAADASGGMVQIPAGTCLINNTGSVITVNGNNVVIQGLGRGTSTLKLGAAAVQNMLKFTGDGYRVEGLTIDGNATNVAGDLSGLVFNESSNVTIRDCEFKDWDNHAVWFVYAASGGENILIEGNEFTNWGVNGGGQGITFERAYSHIVVAFNYLHDSAGSGTNNVTAIEFGGTADAGDVYPVTYFAAIGNRIESIGMSGTGASRGISFNAAAPATNGKTQYGTITGNVIDQTEGDAISGTNADNVTISGNTISNGDEGGIVCLGCRWLTIDGNTIYGQGGDGAGAIIASFRENATTEHASSDVRITDNNIYDHDPANATTAGAIFASGALDTNTKAGKRIFIENNNIFHSTALLGDYGIQVTSGAAAGTWEDVAISNNYVESADVTGIDLAYITDARVFGNRSFVNGDDSFTFANMTTMKAGRNEFDDASACSGTATMNGATAVVVTTKCAHTGMKVHVTRTTEPTTTGPIFFGNIVNATSFDLDSKAGDDGNVFWEIVE